MGETHALDRDLTRGADWDDDGGYGVLGGRALCRSRSAGANREGIFGEDRLLRPHHAKADEAGGASRLFHHLVLSGRHGEVVLPFEELIEIVGYASELAAE